MLDVKGQRASVAIKTRRYAGVDCGQLKLPSGKQGEDIVETEINKRQANCSERSVMERNRSRMDKATLGE